MLNKMKGTNNKQKQEKIMLAISPEAQILLLQHSKVVDTFWLSLLQLSI